MGLWRYTLTLEPAHGRGRSTMLRTISTTIDGWLSVVPLLAAEGNDAVQLQALVQEVRQCKEWVDQAQMAMQLLAQVDSAHETTARLSTSENAPRRAH